MFKRFAELVLVFKWPLFLSLALVTFLLGQKAMLLKIDPSMESMFIKDSQEYRYYQEYKERYGSDQMIAVAVKTVDLFTYRNLRALKRITEKIESYDQVEHVLSLTNSMDIKHKFMGIKIVPALEEVWKEDKKPQEVKEEILSNELFSKNLISEDGSVANILVYLKTSEDKSKNGKFLEDLRAYLEKEQRPDMEFFVAGSPVEQYDFIKMIRHDQFTFVPLITGLLILTTLLIYRSLACMILSMSIVFMTVAWTIGTIVLLGEPLNLMTSLLAPVIMIIAVVNSIHLMNLFFELRPHHPSLKKAVVLTMDQLGVPCLLTHATTIIGFLSLAINPIPAIQSFGIFAALGTFYSYIVEMLLTPILLPILPYRRLSDSFDERNFFNRVVIGFLEKLEFRWQWWILTFTVVGVITSVVFIRKLEVDTNIVKQMKPDIPLAVATRFIDENLTGVYSLGFVIKRKDGQPMTDHQSLSDIDKFKTFMESRSEIPKVNSITTLIKKIHSARVGKKEAYLIPKQQKELNRYFKGIREAKDPEIAKLLSPDFTEVRVEARMKAVGTREGAALEQAAKDYLALEMGRDYEFIQTGNVVLLGRMAKDLVHHQLRSFFVAFGCILILIVIIFRSFKMGLLAAIPNIFPILAIYGLMGILRIELSSTTAMISSIVLGLVVDSSIHFLHRFKMEFKRRYQYVQTLHHTYRNVGQALLVSTLILMAGFASSVFASFRPTVHFGVLTSCTIFFALICTLVILPVCLVMWKPFGQQRLFKKKPHRRGFKEVRIKER